ncbi:porin [Caulobacter sp.]|uniref:porin n=1 Tax=Caulobacter sp. TaxID=78 RepID=UPI003BB05BF2
MRSIVLFALLGGLSTGAQAAERSSTSPAPGLTWRNITLYGTLDAGLTHQSHGAPLDSDYPQGLEHLISKNSDRSVTALSPNGLSQSKLGLKGAEPLGHDLSLIFQIETGFSPLSGRLADGPKTLVKNNGVALNRQTSNGDSSRAGQVLQGVAFVGVTSKRGASLTFGRQNALMLDNIIAYDPQGASYAFSPIGYSGLAGGMGATEDARVDRALKVRYAPGPYRLTVLYKLSGSEGGARRVHAVDLGGDYRGVSVDAIYNQVRGAMSASSLSATHLAAGAPAASLAATISDNVSYGVQTRYTTGPLKLYGGWERIAFSNPRTPLLAGRETVGGYRISVVNNAAYQHRKVMDIVWTGARRAINPRLDAAAAVYLYTQNSYSGDGCDDARSAACGGRLLATSLSLTYKTTPRFNLYGGAMYSKVEGGMAAGFLHTASINPTVGARFNF